MDNEERKDEGVEESDVVKETVDTPEETTTEEAPVDEVTSTEEETVEKSDETSDNKEGGATE